MLYRLHENHNSKQGFPNKVWGDPSQWREMENVAGGFNLYDGGQLRRNDFDHSNLFQGQKQHSVNIQYILIKIKIGFTCVYKKQEVKIEMLQMQWLQTKLKFLVHYNVNFWLAAGTPPIPTSRENSDNMYEV